MAIPRMFNSNTPFVMVAGGSGLSFLGKQDGQECEEEKESLVQAVGPHLSRVMEHGTAKPMVEEGRDESEERPYVSIITQAEGEESQEFSPTGIQYCHSRSQMLKRNSKKTAPDSGGAPKLPHHHLRRKQRRKTLAARQRQDEDEEPPIIQGLWVQEIDWLRSVDKDIIPPPSQFNDWIMDACCHGDCSLASVSETCINDVASASCCTSEDANGCVSRLEEVSLSEDQCGLKDTAASSSVESRGLSDSDWGPEDPGGSESICTHESESDSSCCEQSSSELVFRLKGASNCFSSTVTAQDSSYVGPGVSDTGFDLMGVSGFSFSHYHAHWDSDSSSSWKDAPESTSRGTGDCAQSLVGISDSTFTPAVTSTSLCTDSFASASDTDMVLDRLRGRVTQMPKHFVSPFFSDLVKHTPNERQCNVHVNEGIMFHNKLQPHEGKYREGKEYCTLHHIQNGSYGDVYCIRDKRTGFECAAKRIALSHFSREEVSTWSALNSPRVVELFGAVREGLNVILFMDLKPGCLAQLVKERGSLPEDLALHYLCQILGALEHLHQRWVLHLDVKVDNVLLSADGRDTFLCDFGLSEILDHNGQSTKAFEGSGFPGTETHMAPEVARGDPRCAKADVWSSCCMLLHMLNGCHPWIRYYSHPLCLKIANEPPPFWEVPSNCNHFTAEAFKAGLQKDPGRRASARELRKKTTKALRAVGGLSHSSTQHVCEQLDHTKSQDGEIPPSAPAMHWVSPWRTTAADEDGSDEEEVVSEYDEDSEAETNSISRDLEWESQPKSLRDDYGENERDWETWSDSEVDIYMGEEEYSPENRIWPRNDRDYEGDWEEEGDDEEGEEEWDSTSSTDYFHALKVHFAVLRKGQQATGYSWGSQPELEYLRDGVTIGSMVLSNSPEPRDHPPSCFSCSDTSQIDASDKDSDRWSDDLSSGVFSSYNSQTDGHLEWMVSANQPSSYCFEGVDIWIENTHGECLRIRERRQVKVGHVAIGISNQISKKAFTLETLDRKTVSSRQEIQESGLWLRCVPAPDGCQYWTWRIKDGKLELRE
ncbi:mitogen-activated protein kinase kinase kinase 14 [Lampris incognitus]|uniref:mitogen-activated protein kinase kinase kinase 14 n=1 Tax=Lampris incognitus TaxID=2546036 RepID=UPI0024B58BF5|nr:mitogen-activated protein kinase kinase kinase 14 [Lampris incognitus]